MRPWWRAVLNVVVMAMTMCSGIKLAAYDASAGNEGHEGERDRRQDPQDLDRAA
jgi:hypothetical protein